MFTFADARTHTLAQALCAHPEGLTLMQLGAKLSPVLPLRTLQRWIGRLVFAGLITRRGKTHQTRYFPGKGRVPVPVKPRKPAAPLAVPKPVPKPEPPPAPKVRESTLPPEFQPAFDGVAPTIIQMGYGDDVATSVLVEAAVRKLHADTDLMNEFAIAALAELDALDRDTAMAKYHVKSDEWDYWRQKWCGPRGLSE